MDKGYKFLAERAFFYFHGEDCERFLNGQITQNIKKATLSQAVRTCLCNAKGKLEAVAYIRGYKAGFLLDCHISLKDVLFERLDRYLIADAVEIEDVTDQLKLYHCINIEMPATATWQVNRFGIEGFETLSLPEKDELSANTLTRLRVKHCVPSWGAELNNNLLPDEALLQESCISYHKGCYTGQEVLSRMKSAGKVNKRLTRFTVNTKITVPFSIPSTRPPSGRPAGLITSVSKKEGSEEWIALGFLNKAYFETEEFIVEDTVIKVY